MSPELRAALGRDLFWRRVWDRYWRISMRTATTETWKRRAPRIREHMVRAVERERAGGR